MLILGIPLHVQSQRQAQPTAGGARQGMVELAMAPILARYQLQLQCLLGSHLRRLVWKNKPRVH